MVKKNVSNNSSIWQYILIFFLLSVFLAGIYFFFFYNPEQKQDNDKEHEDKDKEDNEDKEDKKHEDNEKEDKDKEDKDKKHEDKENTDKDKESDCPNVLIRQGRQLMMFNTNKPEVHPVLFDSLDDYIYYVKIQRTKYGKHCPVLFLQQETNAQGEDMYRVRPGPFNTDAGLPTPTQINTEQITQIKNYLGTSKGLPQLQIAPKAFNQNTPFIGSFSPVNPLVSMSNPNPSAVPYVDASRDNPKYNQNLYPGFDPHNQYQGVFTTLDQVHKLTEKDTTNGMSDNPMDPNWGGVLFTSEKVASGKYDDNMVSKPVYSGHPNVYTNPALMPPVIPGSYPPVTQGPTMPTKSTSSPYKK